MKRITSKIGKQYGRWIIIDQFVKLDKSTRRTWFKAKCECGNIKELRSHSVLTGDSKSCGCLLMEIITGNNYGNKNPDESALNAFYYSYKSNTISHL